MSIADTYPTLTFETLPDWENWLEQHHSEANGIWIKLAKKASGIQSVTRSDALDGALCYGWIDGQAKPLDSQYWLQKYTPRRPRSIWSKVNRDRITVLQATGRMRPSGLQQVAQAQADGRWEAAYEGQRLAKIPEDFQHALEQNEQAYTFFRSLSSQNRYAILLSILTARKAETRAARIQRSIIKLVNNEKFYQ